MLTVAIQGVRGAFHEIAANNYFDQKIKLLYCDTFPGVFSALHDGQADAGVLAIGNSTFGDIGKVYEILVDNHLDKKSKLKYWITGEVYINVEQCLLGVPGTSLETIKEVHSQAPALGQCFNFLSNKFSKALEIEHDDTARSAQLVSEWQDISKAAIASRQAAAQYGLDVIVSGVQDHKLNVTRFVVVETVQNQRRGTTKTSLLLKTGHQPGSLAKALVLFSDFDINLSYLQSVPIAGKPFQYRFYIDMEAGVNESRVKKALKELELTGYEVNILGSYRKANIPTTIK